MKPLRRVPHIVVLAALLGIGPGTTPARACTLPPCPPPVPPLKAGATVPANVPALRIAGLFTTNVVDLELLTDAGAKVETQVERGDGYAQLVLAQPLSPGQAYRLRYREACASPVPPGTSPEGGSIDGGGATHEVPLVAGAIAALPGTLGEATLAPVHIADDPSAFIGKLAVGEFLVVPSAELTPFLPVTTFEVRLNGSTFTASATRPGDLDASGGKLVVRSMCSGALSTCGDYAALGPHTATVAAVIPGLPQAIVSAPFALDLSCGDRDGGRDASSEAMPTIDAAPPPIDPGSIDATSPPPVSPPQTDAEVEGGRIDADIGASADPAGMDSSCSCSTQGRANPAPWWMLLSMALWARGRRRRFDR